MNNHDRHARRQRGRLRRRSGKKRGSIAGLVIGAGAAIGLLVALLSGELTGGFLRFSGSNGESPAAGSLEALSARVVVALDGAFSAQFAGEMMAAVHQQKGDTDDLLLDLEAAPPRADFVEQVARSNAIGVTSGQKFLLARWRGTPVVAFGASFLDTPTAVFALKQSGIRTPQDLVGNTLGYQPDGENNVVFDAMFAQLGLPRSQVNKIAADDGLAALIQGKVSATLSSLGRRPVAPDGGIVPVNVIRPSDYGIHVPGLVYFTSEVTFRDRQFLLGRALRKLVGGWRQVYDDIPAAAAIVAGYDPARLSVADVDFALRAQRDLVRPVGTRIADFDQSRWNTLRDILLYAKLGKETVSLSQAVTYDVLRDIYREAPDAKSVDQLRKSGE